MKLARLTVTCLNGMSSKVGVGKYLPSGLTIQNGLKQENYLWTLFFIFTLELNGTRQLLLYATDVRLLGGNINIVRCTHIR
jgi:hypothetical protein